MEDAPPPRPAQTAKVVGELLKRRLLGDLPLADLLQHRCTLLLQPGQDLVGCALTVSRGLVIQSESFHLAPLFRSQSAALRAQFGKTGAVIDKAREHRSLLRDAFIKVSERLLQAGEALGVTASPGLEGFRLGNQPANLTTRRLQRGLLAQCHVPRLAGVRQQALLPVSDLGDEALEPIHPLAQCLQLGHHGAQLIAVAAELGLDRASGYGKGLQSASVPCLGISEGVGESQLEIVAELLGPGWRPREFSAELIQHFAGRLIYGDAGPVYHGSCI